MASIFDLLNEILDGSFLSFLMVGEYVNVLI